MDDADCRKEPDDLLEEPEGTPTRRPFQKPGAYCRIPLIAEASCRSVHITV
jgi:hypothetical protein